MAPRRRATMPAPERLVCDQDVRDRVTGELGTTFLLEAGAGTGKTRVLVDRYVKCVLAEALGSGDVRTVAAITFTEKAAGELRQRVREEFEARATQAEAGSAAAEAIDSALAALDDAPISTIHGFAGRLLREYPVEAGVDPAFEQLDGLGSDIERARLWEEWLTELAAADSSGEATAQAVGSPACAVASPDESAAASSVSHSSPRRARSMSEPSPSSCSKAGSTPASTGYSRSRRPAKPWMVLMGASSRAARALSIASAAAEPASACVARASNSSRTRWRSSPAAFSVNVIAATVRTSPLPSASSSTHLT